jgi:hypothetical protein
VGGIAPRGGSGVTAADTGAGHPGPLRGLRVVLADWGIDGPDDTVR